MIIYYTFTSIHSNMKQVKSKS